MIPEVSWASRAAPCPSQRITSHNSKVGSLHPAPTSCRGLRSADLTALRHPAEKNRITAAGGFVDFGRVNGNLALSRAIGDFEFKKGFDLPPESQIVTAYPDVKVHELTDEDEFLVLACDGK